MKSAQQQNAETSSLKVYQHLDRITALATKCANFGTQCVILH